MNILITAGPTREHIDTVRFISNASSGQMGCAVATAACKAGHDVTLLLGPVAGAVGQISSAARKLLDIPEKCHVLPFVSFEDLQTSLYEHFPACDVLIMAAAVGDFRAEKTLPAKLRRSEGPILMRLFPTEDLLAGVAADKRNGQQIIAFAVEDGTAQQQEAKARREMIAKGADFTVINGPAAMASSNSLACIISRDNMPLPWDHRPKKQLADEIVKLLG